MIRTFPGLVLPLIFIASCSAHSTPAAPSPPVLDLVPGSYALTLSMSQTGDPVCTAAGCFATSLCFGNSDASTVRTVTGAVRLERARDAITIRPDDPSSTFRLDLQIRGSALTGSASGQFRENGQQLSVEPRSGAEVAAATGTVMSASVAGKIDGEVSSGGYGCSNNAHGWTLTRRP